MADYRLPMDADGVKYHGVVDEDGQFPGQVLYGLDKNGRLKPVNVDGEGNVLTRVTGSIVEKQVEVLSVSKNLDRLVNLGKNATSGPSYNAKPVDVSNYINKMIVVHNKGNVAIRLDYLRYYLEGDTDENSLVISQDISNLWIGKGEVEIIDKEMVEALSVALPFMNIRIGQSNSLF